MPEAFKNNFNLDVIGHLGSQLKRNYAAFDEQTFFAKASHKLDDLELKERSNQICEALMHSLPADFSVASQIILNSLAEPSLDDSLQFENTNKGHESAEAAGIAGWVMMPVSDYVTKAALLNIKDARSPNFKTGLDLLKECTKRFSAEFAIRPFLRDFPEETLQVLHEWALDDNVHVRRLVSEGSRPLLPWGLRLQAFAKNPDAIIPLLILLRDDASEYVRRSVANNLNDIAKHHPDRVAQICADWQQENHKNRSRLIKHACRTLLKNGHAGALALFGYLPADLEDVKMALNCESVQVGDSLSLTISVSNQQKHAQSLLIDYIVHHQKANGSLSPKVFKWTSLNLQAGGHKSVTKQHSFKPVTTRKYYAGAHKIEILINGKVFCEQEFVLKA